jgi:tetratricopeptide (TPR) repeat protein
MRASARLASCLPLFLLLYLLPSVGPLAQQQTQVEEQGSVDWYYHRALEAIQGESYETAVRIVEEAKGRYPQVASLDLLLGDLYYDHDLYGLALEQYLAADGKQGEDYVTLLQIARCCGKLNRERQSIATLERLVELYPYSVSAIDDLGWMYFKTHQLEKGERLLQQALEDYGPDPGIYMTLGTICSGLYDYEGSRRYYLQAIEEALKGEDDYFASVAYYNLSLLEHTFYRYNSALRYTEESLRSADRAPGHLARGELFQSRMDFGRALAEYQLAQAGDDTPLSKVNMATLYQKFGMLELARRYAEQVLRSGDRSWMYYYGIDVQRHLKDVHEILADVHEGLARVELRKPRAGPFARLGALFSSLRHRLLGYYHRQKFRLYSLEVGKVYLQENDYLDADWEFYRGNEAYRPVALKYLGLARQIEVQVSPPAEAYYLQEEGKIRRLPALLESSLELLDPFWEKEGICDSLRYLIPLLPAHSLERRQALNRLYAINPGALLQNGLALPLQIELPQEGLTGATVRRLLRLLRRTGSELSLAPQVGFRYRLSLRAGPGGNLRFVLSDGEEGRVLREGTVESGQAKGPGRALGLAVAIVESVYSVR